VTGADFKPSEADQAGQQAVVLAALRDGPATTLQLREQGVSSPAPRVLELRRAGFQIATHRVGRVACYALHTDAAICGLAVGAAGLLSQPGVFT
jgi:hypothetical protein